MFFSINIALGNLIECFVIRIKVHMDTYVRKLHSPCIIENVLENHNL